MSINRVILHSEQAATLVSDTFSTDVNSQLNICMYMTRISYRMEGSIPKTDARTFVQNLITQKHFEPLEFVTLYMYDEPTSLEYPYTAFVEKLANTTSSHVRHACTFKGVEPDKRVIITTLREAVEHYLDCYDETGREFFDSIFFKQLSNHIIPTKDMWNILSRVTNPASIYRVNYIVDTNRQIATEMSRHRALSKNWESTRHVNYAKGGAMKMNITIPNSNGQVDSAIMTCMEAIAEQYEKLVQEKDLKTAAYLLPSCLSVRVGFAGFLDDVVHMLTMRTTNYCGKPHDDACDLGHRIADILINDPVINENPKLCNIVKNSTL